MSKHLNELKKDQSVSGKARQEDYKIEIERTEDAFNDTISNMQLIFEKLFEQLNKFGATKEKPYTADLDNLLIEFYIDDNKNIHYKKIK